MQEILGSLGAVALLAAIVGGGLSAAGAKVPVIPSVPRQFLLASAGALLLVMAFTIADEDPDGESTTTTKPGTTTSSTSAETTTSSSEASTTTQHLPPPEMEVIEFDLVRESEDDPSCTFSARVENQGPGVATNIAVIVFLENLRGPGAPDHVSFQQTLEGPSELLEQTGAEYRSVLTEPMMKGDVWIYEGEVKVTGESVTSFAGPSYGASCTND